MGLVLVRADEVLRRIVGDVAAAEVAGSNAAWKADEELGVVVDTAGDEVLPQIVVEGGPGNSVASRVVVKLNPELVELGLLENGLHLEVVVRLRALRGGRKDHILVVVVDQVAKVVDHADIRLLVSYMFELAMCKIRCAHL